MADDKTTYGLADEPPPERRYVAQPGFKASRSRPEQDDTPAWRKLLAGDIFLWLYAACAVIWVTFGLMARRDPAWAYALMAAGFGVVAICAVWKILSIFAESPAAGMLSMLSGWYQAIYLRLNPEVAWRPRLLALVGVLMVMTGFGLSFKR